MKANYKQKVQVQKEVAASNDGFNFAMKITTIALNNLYGFGAKRLAAVETEIERLLIEEFGIDMDKSVIGIERRLEQIMKRNMK